jgi:hypothetical protein
MTRLREKTTITAIRPLRDDAQSSIRIVLEPRSQSAVCEIFGCVADSAAGSVWMTRYSEKAG